MNTVRTPHGAGLQLAQLFNIVPEVQAHSTLNEKFQVAHEETLSITEMPSASYICIGNGGHNSTTANNITSIQGVPRLTLATALYNHIPFIIRPVADDLSANERSLYRLRVIETHGGVDYAAYYCRKFSVSTVYITTEHTATESDLNPVKPITTDTTSISTVAKIPFDLTAEEVTEIKDAQQLIHGVEGFATISEIALVTGVDRSITADFNGTSDYYTEVIAAQIHSSSNAGRLLDFTDSVLTPSVLTVGTLDPLIVAS